MKNTQKHLNHTNALFTLLTLAATLSLGTTAFAGNHKWNDSNDPRNLDGRYKMNFDQLPTSGNLDTTKRGWADSYWPENRGYIADRYQQRGYHYLFNKYKAPSLNDVQNMSLADLNLLSPAEKFDIIRGRYDMPIANSFKDIKPKKKFWWRGVCNGWTQASLNVDEPQNIVYDIPKTNLKMPLGSGDIKGLLAYYYAVKDDSPTSYVGKSCRNTIGKIFFDADGACADVNAAAFHVVITNEIGLKKLGVAMDRDPTVEVWNQPFTGFETTVDRVKESDFGDSAPEETKKQVFVTTKVTYVNELYEISPDEIGDGMKVEDLEDDVHAMPSYDPVLGTAKQKLKTLTYQYVLDLDSRGNIIGGDWTGGDPHPDLIWRTKYFAPGMSTDDKGNPDDWRILRDILRKSANLVDPTETDEANPSVTAPDTTPATDSTSHDSGLFIMSHWF